MSLTDPGRRDIMAFVVSVLFAVAATLVCVAFGAGAIPAPTPEAKAAIPASAPVPPQDHEQRAAAKTSADSMTYTFPHG